MEFFMERCVQSDIESVKEVMDQAFDQMAHKEWFVTDDAEVLERYLAGEGFILKAFDPANGELAAFLTVWYPGLSADNLGRDLGFTAEQLRETAHMESVAVKEKYRGNGLQSGLLREAERLLQEENAQKTKEKIRYLIGTVHPDNTPSRKSFLAQGYEAAARVEKYGGLPRDIMYKEI